CNDISAVDNDSDPGLGETGTAERAGGRGTSHAAILYVAQGLLAPNLVPRTAYLVLRPSCRIAPCTLAACRPKTTYSPRSERPSLKAYAARATRPTAGRKTGSSNSSAPSASNEFAGNRSKWRVGSLARRRWRSPR